jgi:hypothetical protein
VRRRHRDYARYIAAVNGGPSAPGRLAGNERIAFLPES